MPVGCSIRASPPRLIVAGAEVAVVGTAVGVLVPVGAVVAVAVGAVVGVAVVVGAVVGAVVEAAVGVESSPQAMSVAPAIPKPATPV